MEGHVDIPRENATAIEPVAGAEPEADAFGMVQRGAVMSSRARPNEADRRDEVAPVRRLLIARLGTARFPLMAAGAIAVAAVLAGAPALAAVLGFLLVAAAAALGPRQSRAQRLSARAEAMRVKRRAGPPNGEALVDALPDPAFLLDPLLAIAHQNAAADAVFGASPERFGARMKFRAPELRDLIERSLNGREEAVLRAFQPAGKERWFEVRAVPIRRGAERATPYTLLMFREQTEARLDARLRSDFVANASHELRTPLASLAGFIETLQGPARDDAPARERFLGIMAEQAGRMTRLVNDLMSLSSLERRAHVAPSDAVDLGSVVRHVVDAARPLALEASVDLSLDVERELPAVVGDRDELIQVVENLVENALRYGASGGRVEVSVGWTGSRVEVGVRDHGDGIAPEHQPRLTERFYRVDAARSRLRMGTGLGLAIVKHILARHGTRLILHSRVGEGARFSFALPTASSSSEKRQGGTKA